MVDESRPTSIPGVETFKHGLSGYNNHGCRCHVCKASMSDYQRRRYQALGPADLERRRERSRQYRAANPEKVAESNRRYRERNSAKIAELKRKWRQDNPDSVREYREANRDAMSEYRREWNKANPEIRKAQVQRYRARKANAEQDGHTYDDMIKRWAQLGYDGCVYCDAGKFEHIDHVIPLSRGGSHTLDNLAPACARCNRAKGSRTVEEFRNKVEV